MSVRGHFDEVAPDYDRWKAKAWYYYDALKESVRAVVPRGRRVLEVGCGTGDILSSLAPADGIGIDLSPAMVAAAQRKHPGLRFQVHDVLSEPLAERFEFIVCVDVMEHAADINKAITTMAAMLEIGGTLVVITANPVWSPMLHLAERLRLKMPEGDHEWQSRAGLLSAIEAAGLSVSSFARSFIVPKSVPLLKRLNTAAWAAPVRQRLGLIQRVVATTR